ncbi:hypothetical protein ACWFMI_10595 [Nocardiopsis terrae]
MEAIGVPWFIVVRHLGPPLFLLAVGGALLVWRRPARPGPVWAALVVNLLAAALPFLWIAVQLLTGRGEATVVGLVMTLLQPGVVVVAWLLLLWAAVSRSGPGRTAPDGAGAADSGDAKRAAENVG